MRDAFLEYLRPWLNRLRADCREAFRIMLAYFLKKDEFPKICWMAHGLPFNDPNDERLMFTWLWDVLYPGTSPSDIDTAGVTEDNDMMGFNYIQGIDLPDEYFKAEGR